VDIAETLELKLRAMSRFESQLKSAPHERSLQALRALALLRGAAVHRRAAEAFVVIREVL
jgi:LmbE family N-acetylglucosaminyl deacetylase